MGWRVKISHVTRFDYDGSASASYNEVRMTPLSDRGQTTLERRLVVRPSAPVWTYTDHWGTIVGVFDLPAPHRSLTIESYARVDTSAAPPLGVPPARDDLRAAGGPVGELLRPTPQTAISPGLAADARERAEGLDAHEAAEALAWHVNERIAYVPGATGVRTSAQEVWEHGKGVCQDMAHLTVALLRAADIPARYVSGYLHPRPEAEIGEAVAGQSHAWIEYWTGEWNALDPTNRTRGGEAHVVVGRGRDYTDVPPIKGVYQGMVSGRQEVVVEVVRLA
ncbi:transglutaminase family protein [Microbispora triticiradicis]|uniref:Transglutaminase family protein n=2 Tax=Microbispora TaxID=2005 RepID=A0ABY3M3N4_9ACTN|nr:MULTISPECIES: transglutaminase family protein [Microbispora]TLP56290.1 transglutaminase family protein [Microbispora fusca]TYB65660.1 transglutaminase family protein [Microbispora tritici]